MGFFIVFFDIGWVLFAIGIMVYGLLIAIGQGAKGLADYINHNACSIALLYYGISAVLSSVTYIFNRGIRLVVSKTVEVLMFITSIICFLLAVTPLFVLIYFDWFPQLITSLGNLIISSIFFFFIAIIGVIIIYALLYSIAGFSSADNDTIYSPVIAIVACIIATIFTGVIVWFITLGCFRNTDSIYYRNLYGDEVYHILNRLFGIKNWK